MKRIISVAVDVLVFLVFGVSLVVVVLSLTSRSTGIPNLLGYTMLNVQTDSMEPTIKVGDMIVSRIPKAGDEYEAGDVVTFHSIVEGQRVSITHRIVQVTDADGILIYSTKGDNAPGWDDETIVSADIIAVWDGIRVPFLGKVMNFLQTQKGFFYCVLLPMIFFFLFVLYRFIMNVVEYNKEKAALAAEEAASAVTVELTEEQKRKAIEEYLAAQNVAKEEKES